MNTAIPPFGELLRAWRQRRRLSQLHLASDAEISQRHLSFLESGRSAPSREMVLRLAERIAVPLRERNALLVAAGFAPIYRERPLNDPALLPARRAVELILAGHEPYPALAVDRHWTLVAANRPVSHLLAGVDPELLRPPVNVLRISLHPKGLAPRIANFREWRGHVLSRLAGQIDSSADPILIRLIEELKGYPAPPSAAPHRPPRESDLAGIAVTFELASDDGVLSFLSTTTMFGTPVDISLSELAIESFFPADPATVTAMRRLSETNAES
jgi:transcriptional regulator with XRE-family HTH domain